MNLKFALDAFHIIQPGNDAISELGSVRGKLTLKRSLVLLACENTVNCDMQSLECDNQGRD